MGRRRRAHAYGSTADPRTHSGATILKPRHIRKLLEALATPWWWMYCSARGAGYHPSWRFFGRPRIYTFSGRGRLRIGRHFKACSSLRFNSIGVTQPVLLRSAPGAELIIGHSVSMSGCTISASTCIRIGNHVTLGSGCLIADSDAHPIDPVARRRNDLSAVARAAVCIEDDVFVGARAIILKGVTIGQGSTIGAGAVVSASIPPYCIAAGNPAKVVKQIPPKKDAEIKGR